MYLRSSGQRGSEEKLEALLDDHPEGIQLLDDKLTKQKPVPVLRVRWSPNKVRGHLSQLADGGFSHCSSTGRRASPDGKKTNSTNIDLVVAGERAMALGTGFRSEMLEGVRATSGGTLAGVSIVPGAGFGATITATAASVATLPDS